MKRVTINVSIQIEGICESFNNIPANSKNISEEARITHYLPNA